MHAEFEHKFNEIAPSAVCPDKRKGPLRDTRSGPLCLRECPTLHAAQIYHDRPLRQPARFRGRETALKNPSASPQRIPRVKKSPRATPMDWRIAIRHSSQNFLATKSAQNFARRFLRERTAKEKSAACDSLCTANGFLTSGCAIYACFLCIVHWKYRCIEILAC